MQGAGFRKRGFRMQGFRVQAFRVQGAGEWGFRARGNRATAGVRLPKRNKTFEINDKDIVSLKDYFIRINEIDNSKNVSDFSQRPQ